MDLKYEPGAYFPERVPRRRGDLTELLTYVQKCYILKRPRFSWTRMTGESTVQGRWGTWFGRGTWHRQRGREPEGRPESLPTARWSGRAPWRRGSGGAPAGSATWCGGSCVANRWRRCPVRRAWRLSMAIELRRERARAAEQRLPVAMRRSRRCARRPPRRRGAVSAFSVCVRSGSAPARRSTRGGRGHPTGAARCRRGEAIGRAAAGGPSH